MMRALLSCVVLCPALAAAKPARGAEEGVWLGALSSGFVVTDMSTGDLDGDGTDEIAVCYVEPRGAHGRGGVAVLTQKGGAERLVFQAVTDGECERIKILSGRLGVLTKEKKQLSWTYGKDLVFIGERGHPLTGIKATASSTLDGTSAAAVIDGDVATTWAEGASGTGISQTVTLTLPRPTHVAYIAILGGSSTTTKVFYESNRVHRASVEVQTKDDLGDTTTGIDFADLGIDIGGDRVAFSLENRPEIRYIRVDKKDVMKLEVRIDSVYLGSKSDDTHIAELVVVPELAANRFTAETVGVAQGGPAKPVATKGGAPAPGSTESDDEDAPPPKTDERTKKLLDDLDQGKRSIVEDDDF